MSFNIKDSEYKKHIKEEAFIWGNTAVEELKKFPPDYVSYTNTLPYVIYRNGFLQRMLKYIKPGQKVLDLGCYNGWFTLELARRGAIVDAHDVAKRAIAIARTYYKKVKAREKFKGEITYYITDLNNGYFSKNTYDVVVIRNILHHISNLDKLLSRVKKSLKSSGILLVDDGLPCGRKEALIVGGFLMLLPTDIPYNQKLQRVFKKGNVLKRTQGLADSKDGSPFEGISGAESVNVIRKYFKIKYYASFAAFIGVLTSQLRVPDSVRVLLLKLLNIIDRSMTKANIVQGSVYYIEATKWDNEK